MLLICLVLGETSHAQVKIIDSTKTTKVSVQSGYFEKKPEFPDAVIYTRDEAGQVYIVHEGVEMWCDQAFVYFKDNFVKAYGNVRISQGDTVSMQSNYGEYNGNTSFAFAAGNVLLTEPKTTLQTDTLYFDRIKQQAYYRSGGTVRDTASTLTSRIGRYFAESKKYQFLSNVVIKNPKYTVYSPQLDFYSESGGAYLYGESKIESETSTVYCERGFYNTRSNTGYFVKNSRVDYNNRILYGDSIYFDRAKGFASATNNIKVLDTLNKSIIRGHYAEVFRDQDSVFITKRAVAVSLQENDSVYVHADTLRVTGKPENRIIKGFYQARMFKQGLDGEQPTSGKCDSIYVNEKLGITKMLRNPILWSGENQMTGDTIHLLNNTVTDQLDTLKVFNNAFLVQKDSLGYNQVKGERLIGLFTNNQLDTVNIIKNTQVIYYSRNDKNELVGINNTVSSSIQLYLENQKIIGIRFLKKVPGKVYPPSQFPENTRLLPGFIWRGDERLMSKQDLFKGKPAPVLPKIRGIPLPKDEGSFFEEVRDEDIKIPEYSKLKPKDLQNREDDPKFQTEPVDSTEIKDQ
ncbi:MAG TPA: OstA-like protein [Flavobacteriaceae bacterium]|nr:OstA-like protein [Flavobacteriaceae bacterium]HQU20165.1 OstA-like protein [Flavobacteriaceae bacterium]HQU64746.1 OstA-like protein [Flavobacteriaceae bacterium]HRW43408.1 OstA-like protein [Flavobacteriaceae bacterium]